MVENIWYNIRHNFPIGFYKVTVPASSFEELIKISLWIDKNNIKGELNNNSGSGTVSAKEIWRAMNLDKSFDYCFTFWHPEDAMAFKLRWL